MGNHVTKREHGPDKANVHMPACCLNRSADQDNVKISSEPVQRRDLNNAESVAVEEKEQDIEEKHESVGHITQHYMDDNEVFGDADVTENNEFASQSPSVTDATRVAATENAWSGANPADTAVRPHLVRLFSRDAPGRQDNTFKERPSESDELHTIQEDNSSGSEDTDDMSSQKHSRGHKLASASFYDHSRHGHGSHGHYRDSGLLESLGRFFGGDKERGRRGSRKVSSED